MKKSIRQALFVSVEMTEEEARSIAKCLRSLEVDGRYVRDDNVIIENAPLMTLTNILENTIMDIDGIEDDEGDED